MFHNNEHLLIYVNSGSAILVSSIALVLYNIRYYDMTITDYVLFIFYPITFKHILQVQNAAFGALKDEVMDLSSKLKHISKEREYLEKTLNKVQVKEMQSLWFKKIFDF